MNWRTKKPEKDSTIKREKYREEGTKAIEMEWIGGGRKEEDGNSEKGWKDEDFLTWTDSGNRRW